MRATGFATTKRARAARCGAVLAATLLLLGAAAAPADALTAPTLTTLASMGAALGGSVTDTAVLTNASAPTGTITFKLYPDAMCMAAPVFTSAPVTLAPLTVSPAFVPTKAGTYYWSATYSGDSANAPATSGCGGFTETVVITKVAPTITTTASAPVKVGGRIGDTAVLAGAHSPASGSVTFKLYGPDDSTCAKSPVFTQTTPLVFPSTQSAAYTPTAPGTYRFVATYSGDGNNAPASSACGDPSEAVVVTGTATGPGGTGNPPGTHCDAAAMAHALIDSLVAALTGGSSAFKATCSAGVRIVLRAREIRPGNPGFPRRDGFTTMANSLSHTTPTGQVVFSFNAQGLGLRNYAHSRGASLLVFGIVHIRPDHTQQSSEAIQIFNLR